MNWISVQKAAQMLERTPRMVYRYIENRQLKSFKSETSGRVWIDRASVESLVRKLRPV